MPETIYVYILSNGFRKLYIGLTSNLERRIHDHKGKLHPGSHTAKYNISQLVYFERFQSITAAINREKQLKGWLRIRKVELIISTNPAWRDLSENWGTPTPHSTQNKEQVADTARQSHTGTLTLNQPVN